MNFSLTDPMHQNSQSQMKKLILHIPHSSDFIPIKEGYMVADDVLESEILKLTDWYTDDLFESEKDLTVVAGFSRIFCDPERFADDALEVMSEVGMGVLYEKADNGSAMREVSPELRKRILDGYYWVHHAALAVAVKGQLEQHRNALIIDCHSYPDVPLLRDLSQADQRPDFNIGTDSFHTSPNLIDLSQKFFASKGYSLGVDWPYSGSIVPMVYYQKDKNVQTLMLEINRKLYLKENTNEKSEGYEQVKRLVQEFLDALREEILI